MHGEVGSAFKELVIDLLKNHFSTKAAMLNVDKSNYSHEICKARLIMMLMQCQIWTSITPKAQSSDLVTCLGLSECNKRDNFDCSDQAQERIRVKPVFHSRISPPLAKNFDIEIIFLPSCVAEEICSAGLVVENFHLLFDLSLTARKNN